VTEHIIDYLENDNIEAKSSVILSQSTSSVREIDAIYREKTANETTRTFESQEYYLAALEGEHGETNERFIDAIEGVRTNAKTHFTMMTEHLKLSTIYSYKGWEADNVFVIITNSSQDIPEVIYTALTRAKENLYIINIRNRKYHSFFTEHLQ
jgi:superfamily I DNA/RNA helicase